MSYMGHFFLFGGELAGWEWYRSEENDPYDTYLDDLTSGIFIWLLEKGPVVILVYLCDRLEAMLNPISRI